MRYYSKGMSIHSDVSGVTTHKKYQQTNPNNKYCLKNGIEINIKRCLTDYSSNIINLVVLTMDNYPENEIVEKVSCCRRLSLFCKLYWKSIIVVLTPFLLMPIFIVETKQSYKCLLCILVISVYWVTGALPLAVSALLPLFFFPLLGIMSSDDVAFTYMKSASMTLLGCLMITVGVMESNLHHRIGLTLVKLWGFSHRRLCFGFGVTTMLISMVVPNPMVLMVTLPVIKDFLNILQREGIAEIYEEPQQKTDEDLSGPYPVPSHIAMCYYVTVAYSASIGSIATFVASPGNMALKGLFETYFPSGPTIEFPLFWINTIVPMFFMQIGIFFFFQFLYLGLFRPKSRAAVSAEIMENEKVALKKAVEDRYAALGPLTFFEMATGFFLLLEICLYLGRKPLSHGGWSEITALTAQNSVPALVIVIAMFIIPRKLSFLKFFNLKLKRSQLPHSSTPGLLAWKQIHEQLPWGFIYLIGTFYHTDLLTGAGYTICCVVKKTGASEVLAHWVYWFKDLPKEVTILLVLVMTKCLAEATLNVVALNLLQPIVSEIAIISRIHPIKMMITVSMGAALTFHFPLATPSNVILANFAHIPTKNMIIGGIGPSIIAVLICWTSLLTWTPFVVPEFEVFPHGWEHENQTIDMKAAFKAHLPLIYS